MSGETEGDVSGWTTDTLRAAILSEIAGAATRFELRVSALESHLDERYETQTEALRAAFAAADKAMQAALLSTREAVIKAETAADKRFESVNEFRKTLADQTATFMPRSESTARWQALGERLDAHTTTADRRIALIESRLEGVVATRAGGGEQTQKTLGLIGAAAGIMAIIGVLITLFTVAGRT